MAFTVIFTLTSAGTDTGPFNISGTTNTGTVVSIANGVSRATLLSGYQVTINDDNITGGTVASTGTCTNTQPWLKPDPGVTPTPTPTSTPTVQLYTYYLAGGVLASQSGTTYCEDPGYLMQLTVQSSGPTTSLLLGTTILSGGLPYNGLGSDYIYAISDTQGDNTFVEGPTGFKYIRITSSGEVIDQGTLICSGGGGGGGGGGIE